jgi:chromosome segregation ATPase
MEEKRKELVEHLKNIELEVHGLKNRINQDKQDVERLTRDIKALTERKNAKIEDKRRAISDISDLEISQQSLRQELEAQQQARMELEKIRDSFRGKYNEKLFEIDESEKG